MSPTQSLCNSCLNPFPQSLLLSTLSRKAQLLDIVRSRRPPSDFETLHIRDVIDLAGTELSRYDTEISRLRTALQKLEADRDILQAYYDVCRGVLPPAHTLPPEVLLEIFALCAPRFSKHNPSDYKEGPILEMRRLAKLPLLQLAQVCSRWRSLVMGSRGLWTSIQGSCALWPADKKDEAVRAILQNVMERSGSLPLSIEIQLHPGHAAALKCLAESSQRWKSACFVGAVCHLTHIASAKRRLPLLESLELRNWGARTRSLDVFSTAPRLTELRISGLEDGVEQLPLHQIRRLEFITIYASDLEESLVTIQRCTSLDILKIAFSASSNRYPIPTLSTHSILLPISSLDLAFRDPIPSVDATKILANIFTRLTVSALTTLSITSPISHKLTLTWPQSDFLSFSSRSSLPSHLRVLDLSSVVLNQLDLSYIITSFPSLVSLSICDPPQLSAFPIITDLLLRDLTLTERGFGSISQAELLPHLRSIRLITLLQFSDITLLDFLRSRAQEPQDVFSCAIHWLADPSRELSTDLFVRIQRLVAARKLMFEARELSQVGVDE